MELWVVGQFKLGTDLGSVWELRGVFDTEDKALAVCVDKTHFIGPVDLNKPFPVENVKWLGCYYPITETD